MSMRQDCKHFESKTLLSGESLSSCVLNRAPDAPLRCPENCEKYERRRVNVNVKYQDIAKSAAGDSVVPDASTSSLDDPEFSDLMSDVADIVNSAADDIVQEVEEEKRKNARKGWRKVLPKRRSKNKRGAGKRGAKNQGGAGKNRKNKRNGKNKNGKNGENDKGKS